MGQFQGWTGPNGFWQWGVRQPRKSLWILEMEMGRWGAERSNLHQVMFVLKLALQTLLMSNTYNLFNFPKTTRCSRKDRQCGLEVMNLCFGLKHP